MPKPIQILTQSGNGLEPTAQISEVYRILDTIGDKRVSVVSINGNKRTGKSFMLNYFLRYLTRNYSSGSSSDWVYGNGDTVLTGFDWRGGVERHTIGIWMWSQPFMVKTSDGTDVALLLFDTQGSFDQNTTFQECAVIFSLSALLSSTMIMNLKSDVSEDKLQFLQFFSYFADQSFSDSEQSDDDCDSMTRLCEKLVFLVRDWQFKSSYQFGCHNDFSPEKKNFKKDFIVPNSAKQCLEAQQTRHQIIKYFGEVSSFLLPHPGLKVAKSAFRGQNELIDKEFLDYVRLFVPTILDSVNIEAKKIGGNCLTGNLMKVYLKKWSQIIESKQYPDAKTLTKITSDVNCMISFNEALSLYENKIRALFTHNLTDNELFGAHIEAANDSVIHFNTKVNNNSSDEMIEDLQIRIIGIYELYDANNSCRIDKEVRDENINMILIDQIDMQNRLDQQKCSQVFVVNELREQLTQEIEETRKRQIESELRLIEESARLEEQMLRQKMENLRIIAETEQNHRKELTELEMRNKRTMDKMLANIRSQTH